jgi:hypothetical protein
MSSNVCLSSPHTCLLAHQNQARHQLTSSQIDVIAICGEGDTVYLLWMLKYSNGFFIWAPPEAHMVVIRCGGNQSASRVYGKVADTKSMGSPRTPVWNQRSSEMPTVWGIRGLAEALKKHLHGMLLSYMIRYAWHVHFEAELPRCRSNRANRQ